MKNISASMRAQLLNKSKKEGKTFQLLSLLYMQEGFLFRLSRSKYFSNFILKGGLLLYTLENYKGRSTKDIDFLGKNIPNDENNLLRIIKDIVFIDVNDGLFFDAKTIKVDTITADAVYQGIRIKLLCYLDTVKNGLQIDIGFGDIIYPKPIKFDYPALLNDKKFKVNAYSIESVIAEKFEAMISYAELNSRMKDYYDLFNIFQKYQIEIDILFEAIRRTFISRGTIVTQNHSFFEPEYWERKQTKMLWDAFLQRIGRPQIDIQKIRDTLWKELNPIIKRLIEW